MPAAHRWTDRDRTRRSLPAAPKAGVAGAALVITGLSKRLGGRTILHDISLDLSHGEIVGVLGRDGAGKSTLLNIVTGLMQADSGRVVLDGIDLTSLPTYRRAMLGLAYLPQEECIFRGMTVSENLDAILETVEPDRRDRAVRLEALLKEFRLLPLRDQSATSLSGGERRRCEVARAVATDPSVILLDEPFAGLDPMSIEDAKRVIGRLRRRQVGVLLCDYNIRETLALMDRAYVLHEGRLIFTGLPAELIEDPEVRRLYLGEARTEAAGS